MKKTIRTTVIITFAILMINVLTGYLMGSPLLSFSSSGGEYVCYRGIGLTVERFFPLTTKDAPDQGHTKLHFEPISLMVTFVIVFLLVVIVRKVFKIIKK